MSTLIITEKPSVAARIAGSIGNADKKSKNGVPYYEVNGDYVAPAVGHILSLDEKKKAGWRYPVFDIEWKPSYTVNKGSKFTKQYFNNIKSLAKKCDSYINACDYDLEGEVIGFNVIKHICKVDPTSPKVLRMKYSTLTKESITRAYENLESPNKGMADAGLTRHILDWYWGINLSRALTLAVRRAKGYITLSIGRVQGPALKILAVRDREIEKFKPTPYWEIEMLAVKDKKKISAMHSEGRFLEKEKAESVKKRCGKTTVVESTRRKKIQQKPPSPFDLTTLQTEAYKHLNIAPRDTLQIAQELYTNAYISYPRTSSQQLPREIDFREIIRKLSGIYGKETGILLSKKRLTPCNGKKKDPAHPAIHPTGETPTSIAGDRKRIYDLICRRFFATFGDIAVRETMTIKLDNNSEIFIAKGTITVEKGWHILYGRYARFKEEELPELRKGDELKVEKITVYGKETQPPKRYTPSSIIREMEKRNLGTKATRSHILDILFKRGYLKGKSIEVTPLGMKVVDTMDKYCPEVVSVKLTRKFEDEMKQIESGKLPMAEVVKEGEEMLIKISKEFTGNEKEIGESLASSLISTWKKKKEGLGKCMKCDGNLVLRKSKFGGYFVGCDSYPQCRFTISMPKGNLKESGKCKECGYSKITVFRGKGKKPWSFCINPNCPTKKRFNAR